MKSEFKLGDKVRVTDCPMSSFVGKEGVVTKIGGQIGLPDTTSSAVVTNKDFPESTVTEFGKHGWWFPDEWLELVEEVES